MTTPPPQGQNPFAQGQAPYPPQPGAPQAGAPYAPVPPQQPKRSVRQYLRIGGIIVGLIVVAGGWYLNHNNDDAKKLAVGDCLTNNGTDSDVKVKQLDCSDPKADYKVLKKDGSTSVSTIACQSVKGTTAALEWKEGSDSFVLCLGDNK
ncbi:LppU/SCO3897 family protein [Streptomyces sp. HUAS TT20]|uniref:LppU/SCO3897 family protein n=1 Tax=Streptomyces sp. HUAS TT20 TaxID=3447509 RepID=UPI0021DA0AAF|nr:hypothetical protein [Streptomyces sp. HUAS 15-9]UXY28664.1 hypothetical protein N8I87_20285 [Streptomyces sp. HUAS 15-9]